MKWIVLVMALFLLFSSVPGVIGQDYVPVDDFNDWAKGVHTDTVNIVNSIKGIRSVDNTQNSTLQTLDKRLRALEQKRAEQPEVPQSEGKTVTITNPLAQAIPAGGSSLEVIAGKNVSVTAANGFSVVKIRAEENVAVGNGTSAGSETKYDRPAMAGATSAAPTQNSNPIAQPISIPAATVPFVSATETLAAEDLQSQIGALRDKVNALEDEVSDLRNTRPNTECLIPEPGCQPSCQQRQPQPGEMVWYHGQYRRVLGP